MWIVAKTKHQDEFRAYSHIENQEGFSAFLPFYWKKRRQRRKTGRMVKERAPLYPGYIFVEIEDGYDWSPIQSTRGIQYVLASDAGIPLEVPPEQMAAVFAESSHDGEVKLKAAVDRRLAAGNIARIVEGVWSGFTGTVVRPPNRRGEVLVDLNVRGNANRILLPKGIVDG